MEGQLPANPRSPAFAEQVFPPHPPGGGAVEVRSGFCRRASSYIKGKVRVWELKFGDCPLPFTCAALQPLLLLDL